MKMRVSSGASVTIGAAAALAIFFYMVDRHRAAECLSAAIAVFLFVAGSLAGISSDFGRRHERQQADQERQP